MGRPVALRLLRYLRDLVGRQVKMTIQMGDKAWTVERPKLCNGYPVRSRIFICPLCGNKWATLRMEGEWYNEIQESPHPACALTYPEVVHPDLRPVPGSLLDNYSINGYDVGLLEALPAELLTREFELHLKAYEALCQQYPQFPSLRQNNPSLPG